MAKVWKYAYNDNTIEVINDAVVELNVNGEVQDRIRGITIGGEMTGQLPSGEAIKVRLGGTLKTECDLFINHKLQTCIDE